MAAPRPAWQAQDDLAYLNQQINRFPNQQMGGLDWNWPVGFPGSVTVCNAAPGAMTYTASSLHG